MPSWNGNETRSERITREAAAALAVLETGGFICSGTRPEGGRGLAYWIEPTGERILKDSFQLLIINEYLSASGDGLFPGHSQTWRLP